ncbi:MAG: siderophore-interacting protein [Gordonia sp. (in: high G+C Gram-positive bacteria)]
MSATTKTASKGWQGAMLKLYRADDFEVTVTGSEQVTDHYVRVHFSGPELLAATPVHPTMWVRAWFEADGKLHQRGYTLVDPDPDAGTFAIEFAVHDGTAARWAQQATAGEILPVTVMGSKFRLPEPSPKGWLIAGDTASMAAINSLLDALTAAGSDAPVTLWFEYQHEDDRTLPLRARPQDTVHWVARERDGEALVDAVRDAAFDAQGHFGWIALDDRSTRAVSAILKNDYKVGRKEVKALAYWRVGKSFA